MMKIIWNLDKTVAIPLNNITHFEINFYETYAKQGNKPWVVTARYVIYTGTSEQIFVADSKEECIDYINDLEGYL